MVSAHDDAYVVAKRPAALSKPVACIPKIAIFLLAEQCYHGNLTSRLRWCRDNKQQQHTTGALALWHHHTHQ